MICDDDPETTRRAITRAAAKAVTAADPERVVACYNFCQQFDTEFLAARQLVMVGSADQFVKGRANSLADIPGFDGCVAVRLMPVQKIEAKA